MVLGLAFAIGMVAGLRSFTAPAAVCWAAHLGWLHLSSRLRSWNHRCRLHFLRARGGGAGVRQKPWIGARTKPGPLIFRLFTGGLSGAASHCAVGLWRSLAGCLGALVGTFGGYQARHWIVSTRKVPDIAVALMEDVIAVGGAFLIGFAGFPRGALLTASHTFSGNASCSEIRGRRSAARGPVRAGPAR